MIGFYILSHVNGERYIPSFLLNDHGPIKKYSGFKVGSTKPEVIALIRDDLDIKKPLIPNHVPVKQEFINLRIKVTRHPYVGCRGVAVLEELILIFRDPCCRPATKQTPRGSNLHWIHQHFPAAVETLSLPRVNPTQKVFTGGRRTERRDRKR